MFTENNRSIATFSSYSITTVESTVVLLKTKRSFCKSLVVTKLLGKHHSTVDMFSLLSFWQRRSGGCSSYLYMCRAKFVLENFQKLGFCWLKIIPICNLVYETKIDRHIRRNLSNRSVQQQFERIQASYVLPRCAAADIVPN